MDKLDDFGLQKMDSDTRIALLTLLEERYEKKSMIIMPQLPLDKWYDYIAEATLKDHHYEREKTSKLESEKDTSRLYKTTLERCLLTTLVSLIWYR